MKDSLEPITYKVKVHCHKQYIAAVWLNRDNSLNDGILIRRRYSKNTLEKGLAKTNSLSSMKSLFMRQQRVPLCVRNVTACSSSSEVIKLMLQKILRTEELMAVSQINIVISFAVGGNGKYAYESRILKSNVVSNCTERTFNL